jgi:16S rRNA (cytosine967-C5)-methyltransferase
VEAALTGTGLAARRAALALLSAVLDAGRPLSDCSAIVERLPEPADRARAQRLAALTLRHLGRADRLLRPFLRRPPPPAVRNALRLATVEMLQEGTPAHAAVDAAVTLLGEGRRTSGGAGLANAVLRKVADLGPQWDALPPSELPGWLRGRLLSAYGAKTVAAIERAHAAGAPLDLTPRHGDADALSAATGGIVLPTGSVRLAAGVQVSALPGYAEGEWWVQDAAAALPVRILAPQAGEAVADLCAAPGGKLLQIAAAGGDATALDQSAERMGRLAENLGRTGLSARTVVADAREWEVETRFPAILLDAPCTATGTIRRHPDLPFVRRPDEVRPLVALQSALIDRAVELLAPGGRICFCTCSLLPEEGERQVEAALARHPHLVPDSEAVLVPGVEPGWRTAEGGLRLRPDFWPEAGGMDGFYIALLRSNP